MVKSRDQFKCVLLAVGYAHDNHRVHAEKTNSNLHAEGLTVDL